VFGQVKKDKKGDADKKLDKNGGKKVYSKEQRKEAVDLYIRYDA
jgi:hypothetical protein